MKKTVKDRALISVAVLQSMIPGERYTLREIAKLAGVSLSSIQLLLAGSIPKNEIRNAYTGKNSVYWHPTDDELAQERQNAKPRLLQASLTGTMHHFASCRI